VSIGALLAILVLILPLVSSIYGQSSDLDTALEEAQKSLDTKKTENARNNPITQSEETDSLASDFKVYENLTYGVKVKYPVDWIPRHNVLDRKSSPEIVFDVLFSPPFENVIDSTSVSITIERLEPATTTLEKYKDRILGNLKNGYPDIKDITTSKDTFAGKSAYKIENMINMIDHWEKSIDLYSVENGTLYGVSALGKPEHIKKYSEDIKQMIG
jgi:hypothetical protein